MKAPKFPTPDRSNGTVEILSGYGGSGIFTP